MINAQVHKFNAVKNIDRILDSYAPVWKQYPAFVAKKKTFDGLKLHIEKLMREPAYEDRKNKFEIEIDLAIMEKLFAEMDNLLKVFEKQHPEFFQKYIGYREILNSGKIVKGIFSEFKTGQNN